MRLMACLAAMIVSAPMLMAQDAAYVVRLDPAAAVDGAEAMASRLAATYGGTVLETSGDAFMLRIPASRARLVAKDPNVASVVAAAHDVSADAVIETVNWTAGVPYAYDGSGNIKEIGADRFAYDSAGRLVRANVNGVARNYTYDAPGNRTGCSQPQGDCQLGISIDSGNNRIRNASYDGSGNLQRLPAGTHTYVYDALDMQIRDVAGPAREFIYTVDDQRLAVYSEAGGGWTWTIRDVNGNVLRELTSSGSSWQWTRDYIWRDGLLLASLQPDPGALAPSRFHYHLDHLGTPRRITDARDRVVGVHDYHAFGPELAGGTDESPLAAIKYTGHERDGGLDYMLARYYDSALGRFLSVDPMLDVENALLRPQTWNRYSYVANNPLGSVDPTGAVLISFTGRGTLLDIAGSAASKITFRADGSIDTSQLTAQDIAGNEGALLLRQMDVSTDVYTYEEGTTAPTRGGTQQVSGVLNLDDNPTDLILPNGNAHQKGPGRFPVTGVNGAVTVDPAVQYRDAATGNLLVPTRAIAFHELAESYARVQNNMLRGPDNGPGAHMVSRLREVILMMQRPNWTPFPAGGSLKR
jgi:RHS repeat-associated protein